LAARDPLAQCTLALAIGDRGAPVTTRCDPCPSMTFATTDSTRLSACVAPLVAAHPRQSGIVALADGRDAFAARALLADQADRSIDARCYIWHDDVSGTILRESLYRAADRGVKVRLLLDDLNTSGQDAVLAALTSHANIELRLFNPFRMRSWRWLGYVTDFARLNRRMHNKSFTVDDQATIVGGRNVGDEYFGVGRGLEFADLDMLAIGPVVGDVASDFDRYWNNASSVAAERLLRSVDAGAIAVARATAERVSRSPEAREYAAALASSPFVGRLVAHQLDFEWAETQMLSDDPEKARGRARRRELLSTKLERIVGPARSELHIVSAYFVPGKLGVRFLAEAARRGVSITVLTNSLEATDVSAVHAGYAKRRKPLLRSGIELFELKREFAPLRVRGRSIKGSSRASLHAKVLSVDGVRAFVGSFNFDPRSARLNTEMGFVIESAKLASTVAEACTSGLMERAYSVQLDERGRLRWIERTDGKEIVHTTEPGTSVWLRLAVRALAKLPIEWLL
jgi:putative cardiolipin synthase